MDLQVPDKLYYKIGEVAKVTGIKTHVLRYWETEFNAIRPNKSRSNQRLYRKQDVEIILRLKDLLYNQGFTIAGARKKLREKPARVVAETAAEPVALAVADPVSRPAADNQLNLPLAGSWDKKILGEIRQDILRLKQSLETTP